MKITLTVGISNSGKTTWANNQSAVQVCRDDLRCMAEFTPSRDLNKYKFSKAKEKKITEMQFTMATASIEAGIDVIVADTNLNEGTRNKWKQFAKEHNVDFEIKEFPCEPHVAKARNQKRDHSIPVSAIDRQYVAWRKYKGLPTYQPMYGKTRAVIFDVDGTLADMTGVRNPFDWHKVHLDKPRASVIELSRMYHKAGFKILVLSGRDGSCRADTIDWLDEYNVPWEALYMREAGDSRPDAEIKEEIFWAKIEPNYSVSKAIDDRDQMVARWRAMGLECWQVQAGDF